VAVKARVVKLNPQRGAVRGRQFVSAKAVDAHLRYLERDGVTKDGAKGQVYSAARDVEDGGAFLERGRQDRHQFRFIVSSEDGARPDCPGGCGTFLTRPDVHLQGDQGGAVANSQVWYADHYHARRSPEPNGQSECSDSPHRRHVVFRRPRREVGKCLHYDAPLP
jgi:hypothetical protein